MTSAVNRLKEFLSKRSEASDSAALQLTPDASTREYFRIGWKGEAAIACVYPEPFDPNENNYLDVTGLLLKSGLPVAEIFAFSGESGVIVLEDLGNAILNDILATADPASREDLIDQSIALIAKIQASTPKAFELDSISSRLKFDEKKLLWELRFFTTHYFGSLRKTSLSPDVSEQMDREFTELCRELESRAKVLCHRDFHAANLMLDNSRRLRIIDHQDARIGSPAYDLASLLLDRVSEVPEQSWLRKKRVLLLDQRIKLGLESIDSRAFDIEFDLTAVQRCLKAIGTFANQTANRGKTGYAHYIEPMFKISFEATERLDRFPILRSVIEDELVN